MASRWLTVGIERWIQGTVEFPFRLGNVGEQIYLDGFALTWTGSARADSNPNATHVRQVLCTLFNPSLQWATPAQGEALRTAGSGENFSVHNGLFAINLKQKGVTPVHVFTPVQYTPTIPLPSGELRISVALQTEGSTQAAECLNLEIQGTVFYHAA